MRFCTALLFFGALVPSVVAQHAWVYQVPDEEHIIAWENSCLLSDGGILSAGWSTTDSSFSVMRLDTDGAAVWLKALRVGGAELSMKPVCVTELSGGDLMVLCGPAGNTNPQDLLLTRLQGSGQPLWVKRLTLPDDGFGVIGKGTVWSAPNGSITACIDHGLSFVILRFDSAGDLLWANRYEAGAGNGWIKSRTLFHADQEGLLAARTQINQPGRGVVAMMVDTAGFLQWSLAYHFSAYPVGYALGKDPTGSYLLTGNSGELGGVFPFVLKFDDAGTPIWRRTYSSSQMSASYAHEVLALPSNGFLLHANPHVIHADSGGGLISDIHASNDSLALVSGSVVGSDDDFLRLRGGATYVTTGGDLWWRAMDMRVPLDQGAECSLSPVQLTNTLTGLDSVVVAPVVASAIAVLEISGSASIEDHVITRELLCDFANSVEGIDRTSQFVLSVIPTPNNGRAVLRFPYPIEPGFTLKVHDAMGRMLLNTRLEPGVTEQLLDLAGSVTGVYTVQVEGLSGHGAVRTVVY